MDTFRFTATYMPVPLIADEAEWRAFQEECRAEQQAARQANRPMRALAPADLESLRELGVNGFHLHGWHPDFAAVQALLEAGHLIFSYADDFYFLAPPGPDGRPDYAACLDYLREKTARCRDRFLLCAALEPFCAFTGPGYPFPRPPLSHAEAYAAYRDHFRKRGDNPFGIYLDYAKARGLNPRDLNIVCGQHQQWHHYCAEWGAQVLFSEGNCDLPNDQVRTALVRGAARQYGRPWFLYWSSYGGVDRRLTRYDRDGRLCSGLSASLALRQFIGSFYSGCDICGGVETPAIQVYYAGRDGRRRRTEFGTGLQRYTEYVFQRHPDRGEPVVPAAVLLDFYHGWAPYEHRVWGGSRPYSRHEEMIDNFFSAAFPGSDRERSNATLPWRDSPFPWRTHAELFALERAGKLDHRRYEKGCRSDSAWGNSFDVVLTNCGLDILRRYKVILALGDVRLEGDLRQNLRKYVEGGGILVLNINHVSPADAEFLGVEWIGQRNILWEVQCAACGRVTRDGDGEIELVRPTTASVLMKAVGGYRFGSPEVRRVPGYAGADPVATTNRVGQGEVILVTLPFLQTAARHALHPAGCDLIDHLMRRVLPVDVQGPPIEYLINRTADALVVTLIHNGPDYWKGAPAQPWSGQIVVPGGRLTGAPITARNWWTDDSLPCERRGSDLAIPVTVAPYEFAIVALSPLKDLQC